MSEPTTESDHVLAVLDEHRGVSVSARWNGSPDPSNWRNIRRHCSCGAVIERERQSVPKPGRSISFLLGGHTFDDPHRRHIAEVLSTRPEVQERQSPVPDANASGGQIYTFEGDIR